MNVAAYILLFTAVGVGFILVHLIAGKIIRPNKPGVEKGTIYECGEPTIGSAWIQFDLRYYVVALLFVIFDVEVAFFFPWAVVFGKANTLAMETDQRVELSRELVPSPQYLPQWGVVPGPVERDAAGGLAWIAFWDILIFFGVLLVGFAYLWKRGDIDWVRSTAAEPPAEAETPLEPLRPQEEVLVGTGPTL